jgi:hypothetical protein
MARREKLLITDYEKLIGKGKILNSNSKVLTKSRSEIYIQ